MELLLSPALIDSPSPPLSRARQLKIVRLIESITVFAIRRLDSLAFFRLAFVFWAVSARGCLRAAVSGAAVSARVSPQNDTVPTPSGRN